MARYTLRQLEVFVEAVRDCNFARTAERLGISQPAVSDHVRALERNLARTLFERRRGTTVVLTAAGERLCQEARAVLDQTDSLSARSAAPVTRQLPVRVFAGPHIFERLLRAALPEFCRAYPHIALEVGAEWPIEDLGALVKRRELDIAVFTAVSGKIPIEAQVICDVSSVVVAHRRLVGRRTLSAEEVSRLPFVLPLAGTPTASWVDRSLRNLGVVPSNVIGRAQYLDVQQKMVENGDAAALLFRECLTGSPVRPQLRILSAEVGGLKRVLLMRRADERPEVHTVAAFLKQTVGVRLDSAA
jgi:LysR family transcriptional regulator, low CO2-responsive transcriptional regulator